MRIRIKVNKLHLDFKELFKICKNVLFDIFTHEKKTIFQQVKYDSQIRRPDPGSESGSAIGKNTGTGSAIRKNTGSGSVNRCDPKSCV
jgi:hypothetical protein